MKQKYFPFIASLYKIWERMISRCHNPKNRDYKFYGAKGVTVCDEWRNNYQLFLDWSLKNGWAKGLHLDKDISGKGVIYSPLTCKWVTAKQNCNNKANNRRFDYYGELLSLMMICEKEDVEYFFVIDRIRKNGMNIYQAINLAKNKCA